MPASFPSSSLCPAWFCFVAPFPPFLVLFVVSSSSSSRGLWCSRGGGHPQRFSIRDGLRAWPGHHQGRERAGLGLGMLVLLEAGPTRALPTHNSCFDNPESRGVPGPVLPWQYSPVLLLCPHVMALAPSAARSWLVPPHPSSPECPRVP